MWSAEYTDLYYVSWYGQMWLQHRLGDGKHRISFPMTTKTIGPNTALCMCRRIFEVQRRRSSRSMAQRCGFPVLYFHLFQNDYGAVWRGSRRNDRPQNFREDLREL